MQLKGWGPWGILWISKDGMIAWRQKSEPKKFPGASKKTQKIPGQNVTPKKSHVESLSLKNFEKELYMYFIGRTTHLEYVGINCGGLPGIFRLF